MINKMAVSQRVRSTSVQSGVGLIEVLIALVVFALGVVGMAGLQLRTLSITMDSTQRTYVVSKSQDIADRIRSSGIPASEYLKGANPYNRQFCLDNEGSIEKCADTIAGNTQGCEVEDMVKFDFYDAFCSGEGSAGEGSLDAQVADWSVDISCAFPDPAAAGIMVNTTSCNQKGATVSVTTSWFARSAINETDDAGAVTSETDSMTLSFVP